jgi:hypothetical protein
MPNSKLGEQLEKLNQEDIAATLLESLIQQPLLLRAFIAICGMDPKKDSYPYNDSPLYRRLLDEGFIVQADPPYLKYWSVNPYCKGVYEKYLKDANLGF